MQTKVDLLIIGGGPAGLTAAQYGARAALKTLLVEEMAFGGQALMIDVLENYPGNLAGKSGYDLACDLHKQAENFGAQFITDSVTALRKNDARFKALLQNGNEIDAAAVILATGAGHRTLDIPGETAFTGKGVSYCASCDGPFFKNKKIFVAGGGDAACDEANFLARITSDITLLVRRAEFRAQKAIAQRVLDNKAVKVRFNTRITAIEGDEKVRKIIVEDVKTGVKTEEAADAVFVFAGIAPRNMLVNGPEAELRITLDRGGFIQTGQNMASSVDGLFAAGDVRSSPFRQVVVAAGEGAVAAHAAAEYIAALSK